MLRFEPVLEGLGRRAGMLKLEPVLEGELYGTWP